MEAGIKPVMESHASSRRATLDGERFEVVVIGGGVNGVAIARECASGGKRTLLLEQSDFASGTTSRSTRIIHGGLRYLEHGELGLVRESLRERQALLRERQHLVRRMPFLLALKPGDRHSALAVRAGLWLYGTLAGSKPAPAAQETERLERLLDSGRSWTIFHYDDAQCEFPERLVAEWLVEAADAGLVARNHSPVLEIEVRDGRVRGVQVRDLLSGQEYRVETACVVNASGPWADRVCGNSGVRRRDPLVGGLRGSHLLLPLFPDAPSAAVYTEAVDGRPIFFIPWNGQLLVGTTEVRDDQDPGRTQPSPSEVEYLLRSLRATFPRASLGQGDVIRGFAGVRPLPYTPGEEESAITRRSYIVDHADDGAGGLFSIVGGKLTTAAALARQVAQRLGVKAAPSGMEAPWPVGEGAESALTQWARQVAQTSPLSEATARAIAEWHCGRALPIVRAAQTDERLRASLCPHSEHIVSEAVHAVQAEYAVSLADILLRRVPVALSGCWSPECGRVAAMRVGTALEWDERRRATELEQFEEERSRFLVKVSTSAESLA